MIAGLVGLVVLLLAPAALADKPTGFDTNGKALGLVGDAGFNSNGYNYSARIFSGPADGVDKTLDGAVWGDPTYANDLLVMKWNAEWDRGNAEGWSNPPYAAWETNEWNGMVPGGSGEVWHYKIQWSQSCVDGQPPDGGYCVWGQFEVLMSQGVAGAAHIWDSLALPNGFGS